MHALHSPTQTHGFDTGFYISCLVILHRANVTSAICKRIFFINFYELRVEFETYLQFALEVMFMDLTYVDKHNIAILEVISLHRKCIFVFPLKYISCNKANQ